METTVTFLRESAELCYTGPRHLFLGWSADCVTRVRRAFSRLVGRIVLHGSEVPFPRIVGGIVAFFRDGVASFVTEPFFGMGWRVL